MWRFALHNRGEADCYRENWGWRRIWKMSRKDAKKRKATRCRFAVHRIAIRVDGPDMVIKTAGILLVGLDGIAVGHYESRSQV
jgi:hypothetical protein